MRGTLRRRRRSRVRLSVRPAACFARCRAGYVSRMTEILLFHHAQGQTRDSWPSPTCCGQPGTPSTRPDLYDGKTFADLDEGVAYAREVGFGTIVERGRLAAEDLPTSSSTPASRWG